jgi:hypothetical protein
MMEPSALCLRSTIGADIVRDSTGRRWCEPLKSDVMELLKETLTASLERDGADKQGSFDSPVQSDPEYRPIFAIPAFPSLIHSIFIISRVKFRGTVPSNHTRSPFESSPNPLFQASSSTSGADLHFMVVCHLLSCYIRLHVLPTAGTGNAWNRSRSHHSHLHPCLVNLTCRPMQGSCRQACFTPSIMLPLSEVYDP